MTVTIGVLARNARLDGIAIAWGTAPKLRLYSGTPPANASAALAANVLLVEVTPAPVAAANGSKNMIGGSKSNTAVASGSAAFYRVYDSGGTICHEQGTVGTGGTDLVISSVVIGVGQAVTITSWTKTEP